jgi:glutaredoxin-related protein
MRRHVVKTIDDRYASRREYSPTMQKYLSYFQLAVSPAYFDVFYEKLATDYEKKYENLVGMSVGSLGNSLNSDFDEDDPYNREDSKQNIIETLNKIRETGYAMMMDGGNAYAVGYAKHVLNAPLDSSNYTYASESIPLFGMVYHGYLSYAGAPTNMAGDIRYEMLKIMENGANPYFIVAYRNTEKLKEDPKLSGYFSISYLSWKDDMIDTYHKLNEALTPVMNSPVKNHEFLIGERVPGADELAADAEADRLAKEEADRLAEESRLEAERQENLKDHLESKNPAPETSDTETDEAPETTAPEVIPDAPEAEEEEENQGYPYTKYTSDDGMIVKVTFENGYSFILNYNIFDVTVKETGDVVIESLGYLVLNEKGEIVINSAEEVAA